MSREDFKNFTFAYLNAFEITKGCNQNFHVLIWEVNVGNPSLKIEILQTFYFIVHKFKENNATFGWVLDQPFFRELNHWLNE